LWITAVTALAAALMLGVGTADAGPVGFWNGTDST